MIRSAFSIFCAAAVTLLLLPCLRLAHAGAVSGDAGRVSYEDHVHVRANPRTQDDLDMMHRLGGLLLSCREGLGPTDFVMPPESMVLLHASGIQFAILDENVQRTIDAERVRLAALGRVDPRDDAWFEDYKDYDAIVAKLQSWATDEPDLVTLIEIGRSIEDRVIWAARISGPGADKPAVLFNAGQHAREWIGPMTAMFIADALITGYDTDEHIRTLVDDVEFFIVPIVNPDGHVYAWTSNRFWRKNRRDNPGTDCDGVDPNRNWGVAWGGAGSSGNPCLETYRGPSPFSEPETQAMRDFYRDHPNIVSNIDFHSFSELILWPWGYTNEHSPDHDTFTVLGQNMNAAIRAVHNHDYNFGPIYTAIYPAAGNSVDWAYGDQGVYAFTIELRPQASGGFELPPDQIIPNGQEILPAALHLAAWSTIDCNGNGIHDATDISSGAIGDCNRNAIPDDCENPLICNETCDVALYVTETTSFVNYGATTDGPDDTGDCAVMTSDVWFMIIGECDGVTTIDVCDADFDCVVEVHRGTCPTLPGDLIKCGRGGCLEGDGTRVTFQSKANNLYRIRVGGADGAQGSASISFSCGTSAECPADVDLDRRVDHVDLLLMFDRWGSCPGPCPPACEGDVDLNCSIDTDDLLAILSAWGDC